MLRGVISCVLVLMVLLGLPVAAEERGYSEYSTEKTGLPGEISAIQYGYALPKEWSEYSYEQTGDPYEVKGESIRQSYAYEDFENVYYWKGAGAKELFSWKFDESTRITWAYLDVDTYVNGSYTNYIGPPLHVYCDGKEIASVGKHDHLKNFQFETDCNCSLLTVKMDDCSGSGRNYTSMVGSWIRIVKDVYRHVISWDEGHGWRFEKPYEPVYGEEPRLPVERVVYSHPLTYRIDYDLDEGEFVSEPPRSYTVLEETRLIEPVKKGYIFAGFELNGRIVDRIPKGTAGDLLLVARWIRKDPLIYAPVKSYRINEEYSLPDILKGTKAVDELEGDISGEIVVKSIRYEDDRFEGYPSGIDTSQAMTVEVTYVVKNSDNRMAEITVKAYILGEGESLKAGAIYPRYISEEYHDSLSADSIWRSGEYRDVLTRVFALLKER